MSQKKRIQMQKDENFYQDTIFFIKNLNISQKFNLIFCFYRFIALYCLILHSH